MRHKLRPAWLSRFCAETHGSTSIEFVIMMPMLFLSFMCAYVFFDGYRQSAVNLKAAYTISDLISRETNVVNDSYIDAMYSLMRELTRTPSPIRIRISVVRWDEADARYYLDWSEARGADFDALTDDDLLGMDDKLPTMPDNERVILVETSNTFVPLYNIGMENIDLNNFVFTRPRFAPQVVFDSGDMTN